MKNNPEQTRLFEETEEEKIAKLRASVREREDLMKTLEKDVKATKDRLANFVYDNTSFGSFECSEENLHDLDAIAAAYRGLVIALLQAKADVGEAYRNLAEAERSR